MLIDIQTHIRHLLLAGLSAGAVGCHGNTAVGTPPTAAQPPAALTSPAPGAPACLNKTLVANDPHDLPIHRYPIDPLDPRLADLYAECVSRDRLCARFCNEVAEITGQFGAPFVERCSISCDAEGRPILTLQAGRGAIGRRPEGFADAVPTAVGTTPGEYFAACAALEAASIPAFRRLVRELRDHGAPEALVARARRAAGDEARHFRAMAALAEAHGAARPALPRVAISRPRALAQMARDNAVEGCVFESFAAATAAWQSRTATSGHVRDVLRGIATDEAEHAQLAWDVHAWANGRLDEPARIELIEAQREAAAALVVAMEDEVDARLIDAAGLPPHAVATQMAIAFSQLLV